MLRVPQFSRYPTSSYSLFLLELPLDCSSLIAIYIPRIVVDVALNHASVDLCT